MVSKRGRKRVAGLLNGTQVIPQRGRPPKRVTTTVTPTTQTTTATTTVSASNPSMSPDRTTTDSSSYIDAVALAAVKLETPDDYGGDHPLSNTSTTADKEDIKPNVQELQQELMRQAQQQHQQHYIGGSSAVATRAIIDPPKSGPSKSNVIIIGDLMDMAGAVAPTPMPGVIVPTPQLGFPPTGLVQTFPGLPAPFNAAMPLAAAGINGLSLPTGIPEGFAAALMGPGVSGFGKLPDDLFPKDVYDLHESDIDEDGYSDIDFDDDDDELFEDDDADDDVFDPQWTDTPTSCRMVFQFARHPSEIGLEGRPKTKEAIFYFDKILGDRKEFFNMMVHSSNCRAQELLLTTGILGQTYFQAITADEMETFFGICLQLSSMKLPTLADYWTEHTHLGFKGFGEKMSLNRFQQIMRVWNFDNLGSVLPQIPIHQPNNLGDLQPLLEFFNQRMKRIYECGQRLVLNEPIMFWKGRLQWARDMSEKFRSNALMLHLLTENNGLILKMVVDVNVEEHKAYERNSKELATQRVQLAEELLKEKLGKGHTVFASTFYSSYGLGYTLCNHHTYCTGFLDSKRYGNSKQLVLSKLQRNSFAVKYGRSIMMGKWKRRDKSVFFYSSDCLAIYPQETSRNNVDTRPKIVKELEWQLQLPADIRKHMLYYQISLDRSEMKWDKQMAVYIFNLIMLNAYILYTMNVQIGRARIIPLQQQDTTQLLSYGEFRNEVMQCLLKLPRPGAGAGHPTDLQQQQDELSTSLNSSRGKGSEESDTSAAKSSKGCTTPTTAGAKLAAARKLLSVEHVATLIPRRRGKTMKKRCRVCRKGGMRRMTKFYCDICPGRPGICDTPCFKIWHLQMRRRLEAGKTFK